MMRFSFIAIIIFAISLTIFNYFRLRPEPLPPAACEIKNFDHVTLLRHLDKEKEFTALKLKSLKNRETLPERELMLKEKLSFIDSVIQVIQAQVRANGSTYNCTEDGYFLFMHEIDLPTFRSIARKEVKANAQAKYRWNTMKMFEVIFPSMILIILYVIGWYLEGKYRSRN